MIFDDKVKSPHISPKLPLLAAMAIFMQSLDSTILNTALPSIATDLNHSPLEMQAVVISYALTLAILIPISGWLAEKYGTRKIFGSAVFLFTIGSLCCALSFNFELLVASRVLQGIGGSMMVPVSRLALIYAYPKNQLLKIMNYVIIPGLVGPLIGPFLGGWLVDIASWHWIFIINIPIGITGIIFAYKIMPNYKRRSKRLDVVGFVLFSLAIILLFLSFELHSSTGLFWVILLCAFFLIFLYVLYAKRVSNPLISLDLFKIRTLRIGIVGNLLTRLGIGSIPFLLPQMIQIAFFQSASMSGIIMMSSAIATMLAKPWVVPLVKRLGYKNILITNTLILAVVISMFALPDKTTPLFLFVPLLLVYGCVNSIQMSSMNTISLSDLTPDNAAGGNSLLAITQQLSMTFGISAGASILRANQVSAFTHGDIGLSFKYTFLILGFITFLSVSIFFFLKKNDGDEMSGHK